MKTPKLVVTCIVLSAAALTIAATPIKQDRPPEIEVGQWIKISDTAGLAVNSTSGNKVAGKLYVKRGDRWLEASVENSPRVVQ
jgi:hypothetical protein